MNTLHSLFTWTLDASLRASLLAGAVLCLQTAMRGHISARWRYTMWLPVLFVLVAPVLPESRWSAEQWFAHEKPSMTAAPMPVDLELSASPLPDTLSLTNEAAQSVPAPAPIDWQQVMVLIWAGGFAFAVIGGLGLYLVEMRRTRLSSTSASSALEHLIQKVAQELNLRRAPDAWVSSRIASPAVAGLWRPVLLLPADFESSFTEAEAELVLRHELMHLKRRDLLLNALICLLQAMHWFNPLLWFAASRVRQDRESACDAQVLASSQDDCRNDYGLALLKVQTTCRPHGFCLGLVGIFDSSKAVKARIRAIAHHGRAKPWMGGVVALMIGGLVLIGATKAEENTKTEAAEKPKARTLTPLPDIKPVVIDSDDAEFDPDHGKIAYTGNVKLTHPQFTLSADDRIEVTMKATKASSTGEKKMSPSEIDKAIATGKLVTVSYQGPNGKSYEGTGQHLSYDAEKGNLTLTGWPTVKAGRNLIAASSESTLMTVDIKGRFSVKGPTQTRLLPENASASTEPKTKRADAISSGSDQHRDKTNAAEMSKRFAAYKTLLAEVQKLQKESLDPAITPEARAKAAAAFDAKLKEARALEQEMKELQQSGSDQLKQEGVSLEVRPKQASRPVVSVDGQLILSSELEDAVAAQRQMIRYQHRDNPADMASALGKLEKTALDQLIDRQLILAEFRKQGGTIKPGYIDEDINRIIQEQFKGDREALIAQLAKQGMTMQKFRDNREKMIIVQVMRAKFGGKQDAPTEEEVKRYYNEHQSKWRTGDRFKVSTITIPKHTSDPGNNVENQKRLAEDLHAKLKDGADFAKLARAYSQDSRSSSGGAWEEMGSQKMNPLIRDVVVASAAGTLAPLIEDANALIIVRVDSKQLGIVSSLDTVRADIEKNIKVDRSAAEVEKWLAGLRAKASIKRFE